MTNENLVYTGKITDGLRNEIGAIFIEKNIDAETEKAPVLIGNIKVNGLNYKVALWNYVQKAKKE